MQPLTKETAVIGWVIKGSEGSSVAARRHNFDYVPVCTVQYKIKEAYHPVNKPLGLWGI